MTTVEWIETHAAHGESLRNEGETLMICPCGATYIYSIEEARKRFEVARQAGMRLQHLFDRV